MFGTKDPLACEAAAAFAEVVSAQATNQTRPRRSCSYYYSEVRVSMVGICTVSGNMLVPLGPLPRNLEGSGQETGTGPDILVLNATYYF